MTVKLMQGNEAIGWGAVAAGCRFYAGYPITPQNEIPEYMARELPKVGGAYVQAESEVAAINMLYGGAGVGKRVLTTSSSPGISLMAGKSFPIGEGGMMVTNNRTLYERCVAYGFYERTGIPTTWGAAPYTNQVFDFDATVIKRLEAARAVLVAKTTLGELAMGEIWFGGKTRNPWNVKEVRQATAMVIDREQSAFLTNGLGATATVPLVTLVVWSNCVRTKA